MMSIRAFDAANIRNFTSATTAVTAAKPVGLAAGDAWWIFHVRRGASSDTGFPPGFDVMSEIIGANHVARTYRRIVTATDVARTQVAWTQSGSNQAMTQSLAITGQARRAIQSVLSDADGSAGTSHSTATGTVAGTAAGPLVAWAANALLAVTYTAPTTQGGAWTKYSDNAQGSSMTLAVFISTTNVAASLSGNVTYTTSASTQTTTTRIRARDASALDPALLDSKQLELKVAAEQEFHDLWRNLPNDSSPEIENVYVMFQETDAAEDWITAKASGANPAAPVRDALTQYRFTTTEDIRDRLDAKQGAAITAFDDGDATALAALTWDFA